VDQGAERRTADRDDQDCNPERQLEADRDRDRSERRDSKDVAMGKIDHTNHAEDQVKAARHQRVDAAQQNAANQEIRYRHGTPTVGNEAAGCARLGSKRLEHAPGMVPPLDRN